MRRLALVAVALMLCMPVLSRWQHSVVHAVSTDDSAMCLSDASRAALEMDAHAGHVPLLKQAGGGLPPHDEHPGHDGTACGYCTLATRLLPVLALVVAVPLPLPTEYSGVSSLPAIPAAFFWRAHNPRGPPLFS